MPLLDAMLTVLIADVEPSVVELVRVTLEDERLQVVAAFDGDGALVTAQAVAPDMIFLDVNMPGPNGFEVCRRLRRDPRFATTPIIMLTAAAQKEDVTEGAAAGADHYLTKPFSPLRLLSLVERVMPSAALWLPD